MNVLRLGGTAAALLLTTATLAGCSWRDCGLNGCDDDDRRGWTDVAHSVSAARDGRDSASLDVVGAATTLTVHAADVGGDLYRVSTPDDSAVAPRMVDADGRSQLHLVDTGEGGPKAVDVRLSPAVTWDIRVTGGQTEIVVDLSGGRFGALDLAGGASRVEVSLPKPGGARTVKLSAGASQFVVHAPEGIPVRVRTGSGAGSVTVDGQGHGGVAAGTAFAPAGWDGAADRYDVDCTAGVGNLTVDRAHP